MPIVACLESWSINQGLLDTTIIPSEIIERYGGFAWELEFVQVAVACF
jgi:hypothetical protein